ncbi:hypothetical protein BGX23_010334 [Mortierella sp. AD031]|nr:hypothetical protein BGX23_010334 [Mortierella sp. AD031]
MSTASSPTSGQPYSTLPTIPQQQQQQQPQVYNNSTASSPASSGSIARPPMSAQRTHPSSPASPTSGQSVNNVLPAYVNSSFSSSVGSAEVVGAIQSGSTANGLPSAQDTNGYDSPAAPPMDSTSTLVSTNSASTTPPTAATAGTTAQAPPQYQEHQHHHHHQQQHQQQHSQSSSSQVQSSVSASRSGSGTGTTRSTTSRKNRTKDEGCQSLSGPRPSATVLPAPTPAMHWSRARVHGQIPPKELRAQTVNLVGESVYVFGGCDTKNCFNTLYIFDADTMHWSQPKTFGSIPPPCRAHSSTLVDNKRLYVFGGGDGPHYFNDVYILDTDTLTWTNPQTTGDRPCRRRAHTTCVYDNCIYVFGGGDGVRALNDTFKLDLADMRWSEVKTTGQIPIARGYHTSNLIKSQFIIYGGSDGHECFSDVHVLDLVGGHDGSRYSCDVVMLNLVTWSWETRKVYGIPPAGRGYHASLLYDSRLFMFGGYNGGTVFDDIYILDLSTCAYLPQITDFQILLRRNDQDDEDYQ